MKSIRLLLSTYYGAFIRPGGGEAELKELSKHLSAEGLTADFYGPNSLSLDSYDYLVHFSVHPDGLSIVEASHKLGLKIILWPNIWFHENSVFEDMNHISRFFELADLIIFKSNAELENVDSHVFINPSKVLIVPWGVDPAYLEPVDPTQFKKLYGLEEYILWVGQIEPVKNQLQVIEALRDINIPMVFVGGYRDKEYFIKCCQTAPERFLFLPQMKHASGMLRSAYRGCSIYVEVPFEPPGLSALEARILGKQLVLSKGSWTDEEFGSSVFVARPDSLDEIRVAVDQAILNQGVKITEVDRILDKHLLPKTLRPLIALLKRD